MNDPCNVVADFPRNFFSHSVNHMFLSTVRNVELTCIIFLASFQKHVFRNQQLLSHGVNRGNFYKVRSSVPKFPSSQYDMLEFLQDTAPLQATAPARPYTVFDSTSFLTRGCLSPPNYQAWGNYNPRCSFLPHFLCRSVNSTLLELHHRV